MEDKRIKNSGDYIGRLAPTPSGLLHKGHAFTFGVARFRAKANGDGNLYLRIEDLDAQRCKKEFVDAAFEDLKWLGLYWDECKSTETSTLFQSKNIENYRSVLKRWAKEGRIYPCAVSRKQLREHPNIRQGPTGELIFPTSLRSIADKFDLEDHMFFNTNWRWRVEEQCKLSFFDQRMGERSYVAGSDFGDFLVWTKAGVPSYEMAVVVDDIGQGVTEVVRGQDLVVSTARQILLYEALGCTPPSWYHCPLVTDENGVRLAKSYDSLSIRTYREEGYQPRDFWNELAKFGMKDAADWLASK